MGKKAFGELESQILYILKSGERKTVKEVHRALGEGNSYNTVMTVMTRLADKKVLAREKIGLQYEYWILSPMSISSFLDKFRQKFLGIRPAAFVSYLIESSEDLTEAELDEMERIVKQARESKK